MIARKQFLRDARAAENVAPLQQQRLQTRPRQISRSDKPIVSAAKDDDVVINGRHGTISICARRCVLDSPNEEGRYSIQRPACTQNLPISASAIELVGSRGPVEFPKRPVTGEFLSSADTSCCPWIRRFSLCWPDISSNGC